MVSERDLVLEDGRRLHVYDTGPRDEADALTVFWLHGTPNLGAPPAPLFADAERLRLRWLSYDRPGYGGSTAHSGRRVAAAADDVARIADAWQVERFAVMALSGGGPHALACAARLPGRVAAVVTVSGPAPFAASGLDWFAGMAPGGASEFRAAVEGRAALAAHLADAPSDPTALTAFDVAILAGEWAWLDSVFGPATANGPDGLLDDDLAYVTDWGCDPAAITTPLLLLHGGEDRLVPVSHARWLARTCGTAELRLSPQDGHLSVLRLAATALDWICAKVRQHPG